MRPFLSLITLIVGVVMLINTPEGAIWLWKCFTPDKLIEKAGSPTLGAMSFNSIIWFIFTAATFFTGGVNFFDPIADAAQKEQKEKLKGLNPEGFDPNYEGK